MNLFLGIAKHLLAVTLTVDVNTDSDSATGVGSGTTGDLRYCLNQINLNNAGPYDLVFTLSTGNEQIQPVGMLPIINLTGMNTVVIDGSNSGGSGTAVTI